MADRRGTEWPYSIIFDERTDTIQGWLEGRGPIGRPHCNVQKHLVVAHSPLHHLCVLSGHFKLCNQAHPL